MKIIKMLICFFFMLVAVPGEEIVKVTWKEASAMCKAGNTILPRVHRRNDMKRSMQLMLNHSLQSMWVDVTRNIMEQWEWVTGDKEKFTLTVNDTRHGCGFWDKINYRLETTDCFRRMGFLCQVNDCKTCSYLGHHASRCHYLGSKCLVMFCETHNWHGARASCLKKHWDLAFIGESEMENMHSLFKHLQCPHLWTGLRREDWVDSSHDYQYFETSLWAADEPSLNGNCAEMKQGDKHFTLNAIDCEKKNQVKCIIGDGEIQLNIHSTEYPRTSGILVNVITKPARSDDNRIVWVVLGTIFTLSAMLAILGVCFCFIEAKHRKRHSNEREYRTRESPILGSEKEDNSTVLDTHKKETEPLQSTFTIENNSETNNECSLRQDIQEETTCRARIEEIVQGLQTREIRFPEQKVYSLGRHGRRTFINHLLGIEINVPQNAVDEFESLNIQFWIVENSNPENQDKVLHFVYDFKPQKRLKKHINIRIKHHIKDLTFLQKLRLCAKLPNWEDWQPVRYKSEINFNVEEPDIYFSSTVDFISIHTRWLTKYKCIWPSPSIDALHLMGFVFPEFKTDKSETDIFYANISVIVVPDIIFNEEILKNIKAQRPAAKVEIDFPMVSSLTWNDRLEIDVSFKDGSWNKVEDQSIWGKSLQDIYKSPADPMKGITLANVVIKSVSSDPSTSDFSLDFILKRDSSCDILQTLDGLAMPCDKPVGLTNSQVTYESGFETCPEESRRSISSSSTNGTVRVADESDGFTPKQLQQIEMVFKSCLKSK